MASCKPSLIWQCFYGLVLFKKNFPSPLWASFHCLNSDISEIRMKLVMNSNSYMLFQRSPLFPLQMCHCLKSLVSPSKVPRTFVDFCGQKCQKEYYRTFVVLDNDIWYLVTTCPGLFHLKANNHILMVFYRKKWRSRPYGPWCTCVLSLCTLKQGGTHRSSSNFVPCTKNMQCRAKILHPSPGYSAQYSWVVGFICWTKSIVS